MGFFSSLDAEKYDRTYQDKELVRRIMAYFKPQTRRLVLISIITLAVAGVGALLPIIVSRGVDLMEGKPALTGILLVALVSWFTLRGAERFNRVLGATGMVAMTRLMGFLMICIGVQFIINGLMVVLGDPAMWAGLAEAVRQGGR